MKKINVCFSTDDNYAKYAATAMLSVISNKMDGDEIVFHILHSNLCEKNLNKLSKIGEVKFHKIDNSIFAPYFNNGVCKNVTIPTLYRLKLPSLLRDLDRILYLDCDLIALKSLSALYNVELEQNQYAAAIPDFAQQAHFERMKFEVCEENFYFNAGVCLMDLAKMRKDGIEEKMFNYLQANWENLSYSDQDVLNFVLLGNVKKMDREFNFITPNFYFNTKQDVTIAHFAGVKPWKIGFYDPFREIFWDFLLQTGFLDEKSGQIQRNKIVMWHKKFFQILLHLKMYPCFYLKKNHRDDFFKIINGFDY